MLEITGYLLQGVNHLCHSDETNHIICRGGRDYQLEIWHRLSIIKEPTDVALHEAMIESGTNPGRHIKGGAIMKERLRRELLQNTFRLEGGEKCAVGGYKNLVYATVTPDSGGFFSISWESLKRAKENNEPIVPDTRVGPEWLRWNV